MKLIYTLFLTLSVVVLASCSSGKSKDVAVESQSAADSTLALTGVDAALAKMQSMRVVEGKVKSGEFFSVLMTNLGMGGTPAYNLAE
jgi:hypothetical protein